MEIKQLKAFLAIAEAKTFTAGARRVNVTQAAISMQIRQLEEELGLPVFVKPANLGSSVGISKAKTAEELREAIDEAEPELKKMAEMTGGMYFRAKDHNALNNIYNIININIPIGLQWLGSTGSCEEEILYLDNLQPL